MKRTYCPYCGKRLRLADDSESVRVRCPVCRESFTVQKSPRMSWLDGFGYFLLPREPRHRNDEEVARAIYHRLIEAGRTGRLPSPCMIVARARGKGDQYTVLMAAASRQQAREAMATGLHDELDRIVPVALERAYPAKIRKWVSTMRHEFRPPCSFEATTDAVETDEVAPRPVPRDISSPARTQAVPVSEAADAAEPSGGPTGEAARAITASPQAETSPDVAAPGPAEADELTPKEEPVLEDDDRRAITPMPASDRPATQHMTVLAAVRRYRWTACLTAAAVTIVGLLWTLLYVPPSYEAFAEVRVHLPRLHELSTEPQATQRMAEGFVNTQLAVMRSPNVLERVLDREEVRRTLWHSGRRGNAPGLGVDRRPGVERMREALGVSAAAGGALARITFRAREADEAALILNAIIEEYAVEIRRRPRNEREQQYRRLLEEQEQTRTRISASEAVAFECRIALGTDSPAQLLNARRLALEDVEAKLRQTKRELVVARLWAEDLETALRDAPTSTRPAGGAQPAGPTGAQTDAATDAATPGQQLATVRLRIRRLEHQEQALQDEAARLRSVWQSTFDLAEKLESAKEQLRRDEEAAAATRRGLLDIEAQGGIPGTLEVLSGASTPSTPVEDSRAGYAILSVGLGLLAGATAAFLRGKFAQTIYTQDDALSAAPVPVLGTVPSALPRRRDADLALREAFRKIRTSLLNRMRPGKGFLLLVTSSRPGEGKTTTAEWLARGLADAGKRVLLVDGDLRRPGLAGRFAVAGREGLVEHLSRGGGGEAPIVSTPQGMLDLLPAGKTRAFDDLDLIANGRFAACTRQWTRTYDVIVLDSPGVLPVADARILSTHADGTILVVRSRYSRRPDVAEALTHLNNAGGNVVGMVLIDAPAEG